MLDKPPYEDQESKEPSTLTWTEEQVEEFCRKLYHTYGYDFSSYSRNSLNRLIRSFIQKSKAMTFAEACQALHNRKRTFLIELINEVTIPTTELFRDPYFFKSIRHHVIPYLQTHANFKIWHAGCSTGQEVFSMAMMLKEHHLLQRSLLYGTDINPCSIEKAKQGIINERLLNRDQQNYIDSGGQGQLNQHWTIKHGFAILSKDCHSRCIFGEHNLVTDAGFGEMQVIFCRNVLIYFNHELQERVLSLLSSSLVERGFLCLGSKESLKGFSIEKYFTPVDKNSKIYRKNFPTNDQENP